MALIETTAPDKAEGKLAELYAQTEQMFGAVPNNVRMLGVSPAILENQLDFAAYYMEHPKLKMHFWAMLRMVVSAQCDSPYCEALNAGLLAQMGLEPGQVDEAKANPEKAPLDDNEKALLLFVLKAVKDPHSVTASDVDELRAKGWTDRDMFDAVAHGSRVVGTNILFDTFKIDADKLG